MSWRGLKNLTLGCLLRNNQHGPDGSTAATAVAAHELAAILEKEEPGVARAVRVHRAGPIVAVDSSVVQVRVDAAASSREEERGRGERAFTGDDVTIYACAVVVVSPGVSNIGTSKVFQVALVRHAPAAAPEGGSHVVGGVESKFIVSSAGYGPGFLTGRDVLAPAGVIQVLPV